MEDSIHFQLIAGGRDFKDREWVTAQLRTSMEVARRAGRTLVVVTGGARGADQLAEQAARTLGLEVRTFHADWDRYGRSAGYRRNELMAGFLLNRQAAGATCDVVLFPGGRGTDHMRNISKRRGLKVYAPVRQPATV